MTIAAVPSVSLLFAAALALVNAWLGVRVIQARYARRVAMGDGGDPLVLARMRAHANFAEYVPTALILMALVEMAGARRTPLWALGSVLVAGRVCHAFGMDRPGVGGLRRAGVGLTFAVTGALIGWALWLLFAGRAG